MKRRVFKCAISPISNDLLNVSIKLLRPNHLDQTWGWMALTLHPFNYFLGKQVAIGEWPGRAKASTSVHLFISPTWETQGICPLTLSPASVILQICIYLCSGMGSHCSTCNLCRMPSSTAARALCKKSHREVERAGLQDPTRDLENKRKETEITPSILHAVTRLLCGGFSALKGLW